MADFSETSIEIIGDESQYGNFRRISGSREVAMKVAAKHSAAAGIGVLLREASGLGLATPPGLSGFQGGRPKPSPVVRLFSFELPKDEIKIEIDVDGKLQSATAVAAGEPAPDVERPSVATAPPAAEMIEVPLVRLAWGRSGDKGDKANVGIIARRAEYYPYILAAVTESAVEQRFSHFLDAELPVTACNPVQRFLLPGLHAVNFLMHAVLGGGGIASIRNDPQGKGYAQLLLEMPVPVPAELIEESR